MAVTPRPLRPRAVAAAVQSEELGSRSPSADRLAWRYQELLLVLFSVRFDNTDAYRMQYATLFGRLLRGAIGDLAPTRD